VTGKESRKPARTRGQSVSVSGPGFISLSITRATEDSLVVALRYSYEGKPPPLRKRVGMAKAILRKALGRLEGCEPAEVGFEEDAIRRVRTDRMEV
jgi:hypothetical protein